MQQKPKRIHDNWLKAYIHHTRFSESPDAYHFWTGVGTVAGALRRRVWIDNSIFQWTPNFYIFLVGPPGVAAKSTSIRVGLSLLERVPGINSGPQSMTWQALAQCLMDCAEEILIPGEDPIPMAAITCGVAELGTFLKTDDKELVDTLVAMWDGQKETFRRQTRTQGNTVIVNPWLNIIACTTPSWLREHFDEGMVGGGLTSRILFVYADRKRHLVAYPGDHVPPKEYKKEAEDLFHDLTIIASLAGPYSFTADAKAFGMSWYEKHWQGERAAHLASPRFEGYIARKQTHIHKVAMVLSAAKRSDLVITLEDLQEAEIAVSSLEPDMLRVFENIGHDAKTSSQQTILAIIKHRKAIWNTDLWRMCFTTMTGKDYTDGIAACLSGGYIRKAVELNAQAGKPEAKFYLVTQEEPPE
jgi:hypothetical protein